MLNRSGIRTVTGAAPTQIIGDVNLQASVGIIVGSAVTDTKTVNGRKIVPAGVPLHVDFANLKTPAVKAVASTADANVVLLHDVDITDGNANGTGLVMGIVNYNRLDSVAKALLTPGTSVSNVLCIAL